MNRNRYVTKLALNEFYIVHLVPNNEKRYEKIIHPIQIRNAINDCWEELDYLQNVLRGGMLRQHYLVSWLTELFELLEEYPSG